MKGGLLARRAANTAVMGINSRMKAFANKITLGNGPQNDQHRLEQIKKKAKENE